MYYGYHMMGGPGFLFGGFFGFLFWMIIACLVVGLLIHLFSNKSVSNNEDEDENAISILKKRYAKGEITKKEFDQMKKDIS